MPRGICRWNDYQAAHAGEGISGADLAAGYARERARAAHAQRQVGTAAAANHAVPEVGSGAALGRRVTPAEESDMSEAWWAGAGACLLFEVCRLDALHGTPSEVAATEQLRALRADLRAVADYGRRNWPHLL